MFFLEFKYPAHALRFAYSDIIENSAYFFLSFLLCMNPTIRLSEFPQVRVIASNPRTPQVIGGTALRDFADAEEEHW